MSNGISIENQQFLHAAVASGAFVSEDAAIDRAVTLLRARQETLERLRHRPIELPQLPSILVLQPDGYVTICDRRIGLHLILERYFAGDDPVSIQDEYPSVAKEDLNQILSFVGEHVEDMRDYLIWYQSIEQLLFETGKHGPSLDELRSRWLARFGSPLELPCR